MEWILFAFIILIAIVAVLSSVLKSPGAGKTAAQYQKRKAFLSAAERSFVGVLDQAVGDRFRVLTKVRVADVIEPVKGQDRSAWQRAFNKISSKHFDYVCCDPATMDVLFAVELNDSSHKAKSRKARDEFLTTACASAGVRLLAFEAKRAYSVVEVKAEIAKVAR